MMAKWARCTYRAVKVMGKRATHKHAARMATRKCHESACTHNCHTCRPGSFILRTHPYAPYASMSLGVTLAPLIMDAIR